MAGQTPYQIVSAAQPCVDIDKGSLLALTRQLEREALAAPPAQIVATLQDARFVTDRTRKVYAELAAAGCPGTLYARDLQSWLAVGVTGLALDDDDPLVDEWVLVVPSADRPVVLAATDLHRPVGRDLSRSFCYGISRQREVVEQCLRVLAPADSRAGSVRA